MSALFRHFRTKCRPISNPKHIISHKSSNTRLPPLLVRCVSSTPIASSRALPGHKTRFIAEQLEDSQTPGEHEDAQARAQRLLEESAAPVVVQDMEEFKDILVENGSYETFMLMVMTRLQPILVYCLHHDPMKFLNGFAHPESAVGRAREATTWLFISAHAWFTRAAAYNAQLLTPLSPEVLRLAELFEKAGIAVEKYVENKGPDVPTWFDIGKMIIDCTDQAWRILPNDIDLYGEAYRDSVDPVQSEGVSPTSDTQGEDMASITDLTSQSISTSADPKSDVSSSVKRKKQI